MFLEIPDRRLARNRIKVLPPSGGDINRLARELGFALDVELETGMKGKRMSMGGIITRMGPCAMPVILGFLALLEPARAQSQDDLRGRIEELERQVQALKRQLQSNEERSSEPAKATPVITAGADGFSFRSADTNFILRLRATVQGDARFYPGNGPGTDTFLMRRVRPNTPASAPNVRRQ